MESGETQVEEALECIPFDQLPISLPNPSDTLEVSLNMILSEKWQDTYNAITNCRILLKSYSEILIPKLSLLINPMGKSIDSLRSQLAKNAVLFYQELSLIKDNELVSTHIGTMLSLLLKVSISSKKFLAKEVDLCLFNASQNCVTEKMILEFCKGTKSASNPMCIKSAKLLAEACGNLSTLGVIIQSMNLLLETISHLIYQGKKPQSSSAIEGVNKLINKFSKAELETIIKSSELNQKMKEILLKQLTGESKHIKEEVSFKEFIKMKKLKDIKESDATTNEI